MQLYDNNISQADTVSSSNVYITIIYIYNQW